MIISKKKDMPNNLLHVVLGSTRKVKNSSERVHAVGIDSVSEHT